MKSRLLQQLFGFVLAILAGTNFLWAQELKGVVQDAETGESMPGVAIQYNQAANLGVITDEKGRFVIPNIRKVQQVVFSFIGYTTLTLGHADFPRDGSNWLVKMETQTSELQEVEVLAGENPALRIVRNAINNRNANNPRKYSSYKYVSYNKDVIAYRMDLPDTLLTKRDSMLFEQDTLKAKDRHMFVIESVTKKWYKEPHKEHEKIIGTKISGFKHPGVAATPDGVQNFGFHENIIPLVNKKFLNPIANGADKKYVYLMKDTLYDGIDTIFVMDYFPEKGSNFEGFKGEISIHTNRWAIYHVTAYPFDVGKINIYLAQDYKLINGQYWFPVQMNFELELERVPLRNTGAVMIGKTYLDSVEIGLPIDDEIFSHIEINIDKDAGYVDDEFWETYRDEELSEKELETYKQMDSIGDRYKFDAILDASRNAYEGFIAVGRIDVEYSKLVAYNEYEGLRLGLGLYTNDRISSKFRVGGYFGHGANDNAWKFGGNFYWYFDKPNDFYITASYKRDVIDPGGIRLTYGGWKSITQQFFNVRMDKVEEVGLSMTYRLGRYSLFQVGMRNFYLQPTYDYAFYGVDYTEGELPQTFAFTEAQLTYRWQYKEKFSTNFGQRVSKGSKYPIVSLAYSKAIPGLWNSEFDYNKLEVGISYRRFTKGLGKTQVKLEAGVVDQAVPWSMNFSGRPSYNASFSVVVKETFQTMRFNEFSSSSYFAFFFMHDFGPLLLRFEHFKPEFRLFQGITYGKLRNPELHSIGFKTLENGYFESGLVLDNLIRINVLNTGYFGIGAGAFYRYGPNQRAIESENWTFKIAFMYSVN